MLCKDAVSFNSVLDATYNSVAAPPWPKIAPKYDREATGGKKGIGVSHESRADKAFVARLTNKAGAPLWDTKFVNGKLVGVVEAKPEKEDGGTGTDWKTVLDSPTPKGSTAMFDPYQHTLKGIQECPYWQRMRRSQNFVMPSEPLTPEEAAKQPLFVTLQGLQGSTVPNTSKTLMQRPRTVAEGPRKAFGKINSDVVTPFIDVAATATVYAYKDKFNRTRSPEQRIPAYLKALPAGASFNRCPSDLHNFYEHRRRKPMVQDLRMFGPPIDMMAYKSLHWGPCNF